MAEPSLEDALKVVESHFGDLTKDSQLIASLKASKQAEMEEEEEKKAKAAKKAAEEEEEQKKAAKAAAEDGEEKSGKKAKKASKTAADDDDDGDNGEKPFTGKKGKKASDDDDDGKSAKIAQLQAAIMRLEAEKTSMKMKPVVDRLLTARIEAGMDPEAVKKMEVGLYASSEADILQRYEEDKIFIEGGRGLVASRTPQPQVAVPFNGGLEASMYAQASGMTLEELLK